MRTLALATLLFCAGCASAPDRASQPTNAAAPQVRPIVIGDQRIIRSTTLGDDREINVWLPPSYKTGERRYPVLYLLDGALSQDFEHIAGLAQYGALSWAFEEIIVVGIETRDRRAELTWRSSDPKENADFPTNGESEKFRDFLSREVKPLIEANYRTDGRDALMGESLAGLFTLETFLRRPEIADSYIAISPSLWWDKGSLAAEAKKRLDNYPKGEREIYLAIASEAGTMREAMLSIVTSLKKEKPKGVAWTFSDRPDLEHSTIYHREALEALEWTFPRPKGE